MRWDKGAMFFTVRDPQFAQLAEEWQQNGTAAFTHVQHLISEVTISLQATRKYGPMDGERKKMGILATVG